MKFYIATSLLRVHAHQVVKKVLLDEGHELTYDWTSHGSVKRISLERLAEVGHNEACGIQEADMLIVLLPGGKGTHVELGMGIALNKPIILHSESPDAFELGEEICAFYCVEGITRVCCSLEDFSTKLPKLIKQEALC